LKKRYSPKTTYTNNPRVQYRQPYFDSAMEHWVVDAVDTEEGMIVAQFLYRARDGALALIQSGDE